MKKDEKKNETCPVQELLKLLSGKWKPEIFRLASISSVRFSSLLRDINGANKQSIATALRELEEAGILDKEIVQEKPLHIEYHLTERGKSMLPIFEKLESLV